MVRIASAIFVAAALMAAPAAAKGPKADAFSGVGKGFGGFDSGAKPGNGIPGGTIGGPRSPRAVAVLLKIFGAVSTVESTQGTN